jgi:hypothetical protein
MLNSVLSIFGYIIYFAFCYFLYHDMQDSVKENNVYDTRKVSLALGFMLALGICYVIDLIRH